MASVTVNLPSSSASVTSAVVRWEPAQGSRPNLGLSLAAPGVSSMFFSQLQLVRPSIPSQAGNVTLRLGLTSRGADVGGPDFSDQMETSGTITLRASDGQEVILTGISDSTEPYQWTPANAAAVATFANHVAGLSDRSLTVRERVSGSFVERAVSTVREKVSGSFVERDVHTVRDKVAGAWVER